MTAHKHVWKSAADIEPLLTGLSDDGLGHLFALSLFWKEVVLGKEYQPSEDWRDIVRLTEAGSHVLERFVSDVGIVSEHALSFALFRLFSYHEILVDWKRSAAHAIEALLARELRSTAVLFPYRFDRERCGRGSVVASSRPLWHTSD